MQSQGISISFQDSKESELLQLADNFTSIINHMFVKMKTHFLNNEECNDGPFKRKKFVEKITLKKLCERAELNRSTFYAHYNEPRDLYIEIENDILEATANHLK